VVTINDRLETACQTNHCFIGLGNFPATYEGSVIDCPVAKTQVRPKLQDGILNEVAAFVEIALLNKE
jgi:hypothetical protein